MSNEMVRLIQAVRQQHFPNSPASSAEIEVVERRIGFSLPKDLVQFYLEMNGAALFTKLDSPYRIVPISDVRPVALDIFDSEIPETRSWMTVCDVRDGNYLAIDLAVPATAPYRIIDCFHETFPDPEYCGTVAASFEELLKRALESHGKSYWL